MAAPKPSLAAWVLANPWPATIAMAAAVLALRVAYLIWLCPYELAPDEAHYWEWSRRLS